MHGMDPGYPGSMMTVRGYGGYGGPARWDDGDSSTPALQQSRTPAVQHSSTPALRHPSSVIRHPSSGCCWSAGSQHMKSSLSTSRRSFSVVVSSLNSQESAPLVKKYSLLPPPKSPALLQEKIFSLSLLSLEQSGSLLLLLETQNTVHTFLLFSLLRPQFLSL